MDDIQIEFVNARTPGFKASGSPSLSRRIRITLVGFSVALSGPAVAGAQHFASDEDLTELIRSRVEESRAVGIVLGVLEADGSTRIVSYGDAGANARALGVRSVFEIGSITKVFTGILLADMVTRGEVSLSDPVSDYLPDSVTMPSRGGVEITLLDLATHHLCWSVVRTNDERYISDNTGSSASERPLH